MFSSLKVYQRILSTRTFPAIPVLSIFLLLFSTTAITGCGRDKSGADVSPADTSGAASQQARQHGIKNYVFVLAIDGMRPDLLKEEPTPNFDRLAAEGTISWNNRVSVPSQTRVNFVTIPTGTHSDKHGIVGAGWRDSEWNLHRTDKPTPKEAQVDLPVPTVFDVLSDLGVKSAYVAMKGYELVGGRGATIQYAGTDIFDASIWKARYESEVDGSVEESVRMKQKLNRALMDRIKKVLADKDVHFMIANIGGTDYVAHKHGPETKYYRETIRQTDELLGEFLDYMEELGIREKSTIIITSDHGFTQIKTPDNVLMGGGGESGGNIPEFDEAGIVHDAMSRGGTSFSLYIKDKDRVGEAYKILRKRPWVSKIYSEHDLSGLDGTLSELHYYSERTGDFFVDITDNYTLNFDNRGQHGSTSDVDMTVALVLSGNKIKDGVVLEKTGNVDIAPTVLALFGLDPDKHLDADGRILTEALAQPVSSEK